ALLFAQNRLTEQSKKLRDTELELQGLRKLSNVYSIDDGRKAKIQERTDAKADLMKIEAETAAQMAKMNALIRERNLQPELVEIPTTVTNPQIEILKASIATLKTQRSGILTLFKPGHTKVQEIDLQIADMEARLAQTPATVTSTSK